MPYTDPERRRRAYERYTLQRAAKPKPLWRDVLFLILSFILLAIVTAFGLYAGYVDMSVKFKLFELLNK
jgi:hypothetical protein